MKCDLLVYLFVGYYCPSGSSVETEIICPAAKHCPIGSAEPADCPAGTHADHNGAATCTVCPEGQYIVIKVISGGQGKNKSQTEIVHWENGDHLIIEIIGSWLIG